jgi:hypothetical protein
MDDQGRDKLAVLARVMVNREGGPILIQRSEFEAINPEFHLHIEHTEDYMIFELVDPSDAVADRRYHGEAIHD